MGATVTVPKLGLTMTGATVARWLKKEGDPVLKGEELVEITTEKLTYTVESPADGVLLEIAAPEGTDLPVGAPLGLVGEPGELGAAAKTQEVEGEHPTGTGPSPAAGLPYEAVPYSGMRKAIGDRMSHSWAVAPRVTEHVAVDMSGLLGLRETINGGLREGEERVSLTAMMVRIVARALELRPYMNASLDGGIIKVFKQINIGVAVALDSGLLVPVVADANKKSVFEINREIRDLAEKARRGDLGEKEMTGGTFTITNLSTYGPVDFFTPIINQPESAILGIGRVSESPVVVDGQIVVRPMAGLSLTFDHRVIDGAPAARFLEELCRLIANPVEAIPERTVNRL